MGGGINHRFINKAAFNPHRRDQHCITLLPRHSCRLISRARRCRCRCRLGQRHVCCCCAVEDVVHGVVRGGAVSSDHATAPVCKGADVFGTRCTRRGNKEGRVAKHVALWRQVNPLLLLPACSSCRWCCCCPAVVLARARERAVASVITATCKLLPPRLRILLCTFALAHGRDAEADFVGSSVQGTREQGEKVRR